MSHGQIAGTPSTIFIGVAWPYASGPRHIGHAAGANLPADIFARYHRMAGNNVLMVSGSDEHGTPITVVADRRGISPREVAEENHQIIADAFERLGCSFDLYTETGTLNHHDVTQDFFLRLLEQGYLFQETTIAAYDPEVKRFLPDRYIEGTCPYCGYADARGDQCDTCGRTLDPVDLIRPRSKLSGATPEQRETTHFFLDLPRFSDRLLAWIEANSDHWRPNVTAFVSNWIREGLKPRAITRDIDWGVPIPVPGFEDKRIYVWFDAVIGYLSASIEWASNKGEREAWHSWWRPREEQEPPRAYYFVGKDNIPFHAIIWPAMLMGYGNLVLPYDVPANEFLTLGGQKISSSRSHTTARLPWLHEFLDLFDADALRYFMTINAPEVRDTDFSWDEFQRRNNDELVATFGNAVHRVLHFVSKRMMGIIPEPGILTERDNRMLASVSDAFTRVTTLLEAVHLRDALGATMGLARELNRYLDDTEPWKALKHDPPRAATALWVSVQVIAALRTLTAPFLPFSAQRLHEYLGESGQATAVPWRMTDLPAGRKIGEPAPLFRKLEDAELSAVASRLDSVSTETGEPA
ncbi:MAG: methionine--tRNA ligase [Chloroflexota bacterium]|nr:methionine--tRNA ligase [Chloroflexota bacterium]